MYIYDYRIYYIWESWFANYPSYLPLRTVFLGSSRFSNRDLLAITSLKRDVRARFLALPPTPVLFVQNRFVARVRRPGAPQTSFFLSWIGPWRPRVQKSAVLYSILCASFENYRKHKLKPQILLSVSLRCCSVFETFYNPGEKHKYVQKTLHVSHGLDS